MLEVVGSLPALAKQRIKFLGLLRLPARVGLLTVSGVTGCASRQLVTSGELEALTKCRYIKLLTRLKHAAKFQIHSLDGSLLCASVPFLSHAFPPPPPTPSGQDLIAMCKPILVQINQQMARIASTGRVYRLAANVLAAASTV